MDGIGRGCGWKGCGWAALVIVADLVVFGYVVLKVPKTVPTDKVKKTIILADTAQNETITLEYMVPQNETISTQEQLQQLRDTIFYKNGKEIERAHYIKPDTIFLDFSKIKL